MATTKHPVIVVGAGIGGLSAALALTARGIPVRILERAATPGGKLREVRAAGRPIDAGPTVFTMRWVFEELFAEAGASLDAHLVLQPLAILARHAWSERERLDLFADRARSAEAIGAFAGPAEGRRYLDFCREAGRVYRTLEAPFIRAPRPNPLSLTARVGLRGLPDLHRIRPFATLWRALGEHFQDPRLRQLFARYATYCGSSPFMAPATLMLIAHVEQEGVWMVEGGMHRIAVALADLARARGAEIRYDAEVADLLVEGGRVRGVRLADGERLEAAAVVFNGDAAALAAGDLGASVRRAVAPVPPARRSLSALTWSLVAEVDDFPLVRHNVFFARDYAAEFDDIFVQGQLPRAGTLYVCAQDRADRDEPAPAGPERLFCLLNAPANGDRHTFDSKEIEQCQQRAFAFLEDCGLRIRAPSDRIAIETPTDFARLFPATGGALYGQASHGWRASFRRPASRARIPGLYLAGGSAHPGAGIPMAALSGRLAAASLLTDLAST